MTAPNGQEPELVILDVDGSALPSAEVLEEQEARRRRRHEALAWGLGAAVTALAMLGVLLTPVTGRCAGATISGHVQKMEHRMDGLVAVDEGQPAPAAEPPSQEKPQP